MSAATPAVAADVAIVGGGMVGASLALALSALALDVVVVEATPPEDGTQPSFDTRTTALSNGTRRIFEGLGVWDEIVREATPIRRIHVSDRGRFGSAVVDAAEQGIPALGYVVENRVIGRALWRRLRLCPRVRLVSPATVTAVRVAEHGVHLDLSGDAATSVAARLAVAADGAGSIVRESAGVGAERWDYDQTAVICQLTPERFHEHVAYERFTASGPIAVLPAPDGRVGLVWTLAPAEDPGSAALLQRYADWRRTDRRALIAFTDGLVRLFGSPWGPVQRARSLGLVLFDLSPPAKSALSKLSLGFAGRLPRLARGLPLVASLP